MNLVEKPALLALDDETAFTGWKIALKRGAVIQAPLCAIGFALGLIAWLHLRDIGNAVRSLAMLANIPLEGCGDPADQSDAAGDRT